MDNKPFTPMTDAAETTEPTEISSQVSVGEQTMRAPPRPRDSSTSSRTTKKLQLSRASSTANSATSSANASRESSPSRPTVKSNTSAPARTGPGRSRKNSHQDVSPARSTSSINPPSAAATQRALSAASIPQLYPATSDLTIKAPVPQKSAVNNNEPRETPRWPVSPRLRSPPPINRPTILSPRKTDQEVPAINVQRSSAPTEEGKAVPDIEAEDSLGIPGMRTPARGASGASGTSSTLETVQEISQPNTPGPGLDGMIEWANRNGVTPLQEHEKTLDNADIRTVKANESTKRSSANESGSESGGKGEMKLRTTSVPPTTRPNAPASKSAAVGVGRGKPPGEGSTRNMTVETETVVSIPQIPVNDGRGGGHNGSIRTKPSTETIRPKKEKKKTARKAPSVTSGTASSKADIFEAKVASAVDEANSSDSEETFVYESNPPDTGPRRFHSRTPSATSMASQADQRNGVRSVMDGNHSVAMKKSMKFANSYSSNGPEMANGDDDGKGTARSTMGTGRGTTHHHHIGGRWNRNGGNGHPSLFDNESPFPNAAKSKLATAPRHSSGPTSPRVANMTQKGPGKRSSPISAGYDLDDAADDERTPLMSTVRSSRSSRNRRSGNSMRQLEHQASRHERGILSRFAGCLVLFLMTILVIAGAIGFMFTTTQPLTFDKTVALKNVLASEQDIIFDMKVQARNPNLVQVIIDSTDLVVFAKSKYAGTDSEYWKRPQITSLLRRVIRIRDDEYFDPPEPLDPTSPNFEIGHVLAFDSPLIFEGSPFNHDPTSSMGQIRVKHPGNSTLPSGSERWGRILEHEFDLIVRGTLRYTLPFGGRVRSVSIEGRVAVEPNAADGGDAKIWNEVEA